MFHYCKNLWQTYNLCIIMYVLYVLKRNPTEKYNDKNLFMTYPFLFMLFDISRMLQQCYSFFFLHVFYIRILGYIQWENYVIKHKITDLLMKCFLYISYIFFCVIYECWWSLVRVIYTYFCFHKMSKRIINFCFSIDSRKKDL